MDRAERLLQRYDLQRGARLRRIDHFNLHVPDVQAAFDHYFSELGFRCSEYIEGDPPDRTLYAAWLFRKPSTHDVALTGGAGPRLHHTAYWLGDLNGIVQLCDALGGSGWFRSIERGPGRHGVSNAFYLYLRDPDGHRIELFTDDYWTGDPDLEPIRWSVHEERRRSFWGHKVAESWYLESSEVVDLDGRPVPLVEPAAEEMKAAVLPR
jgi:catechol 2,3-dioxygenase-like lactoylglutathione lyase family enzyme